MIDAVCMVEAKQGAKLDSGCWLIVFLAVTRSLGSAILCCPDDFHRAGLSSSAGDGVASIQNRFDDECGNSFRPLK